MLNYLLRIIAGLQYVLDGEKIKSHKDKFIWLSEIPKGQSDEPVLRWKNASRSNPRVQAFEKFSAHMLRHTYATMLYDASVDIKSAQYFLGHASIELTLSIYTHLTPYKVDQAIGSFNAHLGERININVTGDYAEYKDE